MEVGTCNSYDEDLEEREISSTSEYTPLQRPVNQPSIKVESIDNQDVTIDKMEGPDDSVSDFGQTSDSSTDSDDCMKNRRSELDINRIKIRNAKKEKRKRTILVRVQPTTEIEDKKAKFKRYDIWAQSLQEDSITENMRGIDVAKYKDDRNVENYDFAMKYVNPESSLKRRLSTSGDDMSDGSNSRQFYQNNKKNNKGRRSRRQRRPKKRSKIGREFSASSCDSVQNLPREILDLNIQQNCSNEDLARELANKLYERKDNLMLRVVNILGKEVSIRLFKETQSIEIDGGMMTIDGKRRRTPGGVFFNLLKNNESITPEERKEIFEEDKKQAILEHRKMQANKRDKKVEELKKCLNERGKAFNSIPKSSDNSTRSHLKPENISLSNPPPSPVANGCPELSPDYKPPTIINHVADTPIEKLLLAKHVAAEAFENNEPLASYEDDFLDMHCDDMELM